MYGGEWVFVRGSFGGVKPTLPGDLRFFADTGRFGATRNSQWVKGTATMPAHRHGPSAL